MKDGDLVWLRERRRWARVSTILPPFVKMRDGYLTRLEYVQTEALRNADIAEQKVRLREARAKAERDRDENAGQIFRKGEEVWSIREISQRLGSSECGARRTLGRIGAKWNPHVHRWVVEVKGGG